MKKIDYPVGITCRAKKPGTGLKWLLPERMKTRLLRLYQLWQEDGGSVAPGVDIYSSVPGNKYKNESGTSMASPVAAGEAALLKSYFPDLSVAEIRRFW